MGSNSNMVPATQEDKDAFRAGQMSNYSKGMVKHIEPYAYDPIPAVNAKGGRNVDGWRSVFAATVQNGPYSPSPPPSNRLARCSAADRSQIGRTASGTCTARRPRGSSMCASLPAPCWSLASG